MFVQVPGPCHSKQIGDASAHAQSISNHSHVFILTLHLTAHEYKAYLL